MVRLPSPIKKVFFNHGAWDRFYQKHKDTIRDIELETMVKLKTCGSSERGFAVYKCSNPSCTHEHRIMKGCKGRFCPTCGKGAADRWIEQQCAILPETDWQHITWTMPDVLWPIFEKNRWLVKELSRIASQIILKDAKKKSVLPGIFTAQHTFGRKLNWNCHVHLSVTLGGLSKDHQKWESIRFCRKSLEPQWRYAVITLLRQHYAKLQFPKEIGRVVRHIWDWNRWLDKQYNRYWNINLAKPKPSHYQNVKYLGGYVKRAPISQSRLKHYNGHEVIFTYKDHRDGRKKQLRLDTEEFIRRFLSHIPEKYQRLINYYGFLANRVRGKLLPQVHDVLGQKMRETRKIRYAQMLKRSFGIDPFECPLCRSQLAFVGLVIGKTSAHLKGKFVAQSLQKIKVKKAA